MNTVLEDMLDAYEQRKISRRALVQGLLAMGVGGSAVGSVLAAPPPDPLVRASTINHVTIYATSVARSKAFYERVTGLPVRDEGKDYCEFRLKEGFLGLYAREADARPGFDHFCLGIEDYDAKRVHALLSKEIPESRPTIENEDQVYFRDPDGVRVQVADVAYKR